MTVSDFPDAEFCASPNFGPRRDGKPADMILLHYTGMETGDAAFRWLCDTASQVSSHYLVFEDGRTLQLVSEKDRAWHAGKSVWQGETDVNSRSIGIEIVNPGHEFGPADFPMAQVSSVISLCRDIVSRHRIAAERVLAHSDVAPGRKRDPGERFPWADLHAGGVGHWVDPAPIRGGRFLTEGERGEPIEALQSMLALYGYGIDINGVFDSRMQSVVEAFQRHFRPEQVDGVADQSTIQTLHRLLSALPDPDRGTS